MLGLGLGLQRGVLLGGLSQEAINWETWIVANGGTIPAATLKIFDDNFFKPAKLNGNILTELDRLNIYCGLNGYEIAARTNTIKNAHFVTPVSSPIFDNDGYRSGGTSYLNLNYNPSTEAVKATLTSASVFAVVKNPVYDANRRIIGCAQASFVNLYGLTRTATPELISAINGGSIVLNPNTTTSGNVFFGGQRSLTTLKSIINSNEQSGASTALGLPNFSAFELTQNVNGSTVSSFDLQPHLASGHGSGNLDMQGLRVILNNLFTALGV